MDSISALAAAFSGKEENYRVYIEQVFRYFEKLEVTSFLISETIQIPTIFSESGIEEFLADGGGNSSIQCKKGNIREKAIEILKLRGASHQKKIVVMQILSDSGMVIYPEHEIFGGLEERTQTA